ncbi:MAG: hypothetical protein SOZ00_01740 [Tidjanibacter sp.]|nr:hypothetical protein [Tidjanibacter sp.]
MKKILLFTALAATLLAGCAQKTKWTAEQREAVREMLREWRRMVYLSDMSDTEFVIFTDNVADLIEVEYPSYTEFVAMPMVGDSVQVVLVSAIVADIQANMRNMRHLMPYDRMVREGVLPSGLTREQQMSFYTCMASSVNKAYGSLNAFVWSLVNSVPDTNGLLAKAQAQCAAPYWDVEVITVEEVN